MSIDPRWIVNLKGKEFVVYAGLLDAATKAGLKEVSVKLIQFPSPENGEVAIAEATVVFEDGRLFTEIGDAGPRSTSPLIAVHCCRLAATRAKGRAFRDGLNVAAVMVEELGGNDEETALPANPARAARSGVARDAAPRPARPDAGADAPAAAPALDPYFCSVCGVEVPAEVAGHALKHFGTALCVTHGKAELAAQRAAAERELVGVSEEE